MRTRRQGHLGVWTTALAGLLLCLPIADALGAFQPVRPILECVTQDGPSQYTAVYGYKNENTFPLIIPIGSRNKFTPWPQDRGQPTVFWPGRTPADRGVFHVPFNDGDLVWTLKGPDGSTRTATASSSSRRCPGPTLTGLDPVSLFLTQGGSGALTATIGAAQPSATTITLRSSDSAIASVPGSVSIPAGQETVAVPVAAGNLGIAVVTASLNGSSRHSVLIVLPGGPTLTSLVPATLQVAQGASGMLTVTISAAQARDTVIPLTTSDAGVVGLPSGNAVTVPAGQLAVAVPVAGLALGSATVTAGPLNGTIAQSQVTVIAPAAAVVGLTPVVLQLSQGSAGTLIVTLNASQPTDTEVSLTTTDPAIVGLLGDHVIVPAHSASAPFTVTGLVRGTALVTAAVNGTSATSAVTVQPPPPIVGALTCPATLTASVTGQCAVTLNATQLTDTLVPLASSDPGIVTVPERVTVPAGAVAVPVPIVAGAPGIATITAGPLNETSKQATVQVLPPPPTLVGLTPSPAALLVGASTTVTLTLNAAQPTDTLITLAVGPAGIVNVATSITVPAGHIAVSIPVSALTLGSAVLTAGPLNGSTVEATITVNQLPPAVTGLTPPELSLPKGTADSLTVTIAPVQPEPTTVPLTSGDPATVEIPGSVPIPAGSATAAFPVIGWNTGTATVIAGPLGGATAQAIVTVTPPVLVTLTIAPTAVTLAVGRTQAFTATGTYTDETTQDLTNTATWTSSADAIATVTNPGGVVTARAVGQAAITATADGKSATATVTVTLPTLTVLALTPTFPARAVGQSIQFQVAGTFTDGATQNLTGTVTWTSSNTAVATITSPGGLATALAAGPTTITATHAAGMTASTTLTVTPPVVTSLALHPANAMVVVGQTLQLTVLATFTGGTTQDVTAQVEWSSGAPLVASVSGAGLVAGLTSGTTTVTATHPSGPTASTTLSVLLPLPTIMSLEPLSHTIPQGGKGTLTVTLNAVQPGETTVGLTSRDPAIVSVPATIIVPGGSVAVAVPVVAVSPGTATITATLNGSSSQSSVTVTPAGPTLTDLSPIALRMAPGASTTMTLTLSAATDTDTTVALASSDPVIAALPAGGNVTIPAGQTNQSASVSGVAPGQATITATLNGSVLQGQVTVTTGPPTVVSLRPTTLGLAEGARGELTLTLSAAQPSAVGVAITTGDSWAIGLPAEQVTVPANTTTVTFPITGVHSSVATVTATLNGSATVAGVWVRQTLPAIRTLTCPPAVTVGATGRCTLTLNAVQVADLDIPLAVTNPAVLAVAPTVRVPGNTGTVAFEVAGLESGSSEITAGPLTETTQQAAIAVVAPTPTLVALEPSAIALAPGAATTLTVTLSAIPPSATTIPINVSGPGVVWSPTSLTVPARDLTTTVPLIGLGVGSATLTVGPLNGTYGQVSVTVSTASPTVVAMIPAQATMPNGWVAPLTVRLTPVQATPTVVAVATDDPWASVLSVPSTVTIPAEASEAAIPVFTFYTGTATVTAGPVNGSTAQASVSVVGTQTTSFAIVPSAATIPQGETQEFKVLHAYSTGIVQDETPWSTWTSSNPAVAKVVAKGKVSSLAPGTVTVSARSEGGRTAAAVLTVGLPPATAVSVTPAAPSLFAGGQLQFLATATFADGSTQDVTSNVAWTIGTTTVAAITSPGGLATGVAPGSTTVTARLGNVVGTATLAVTPATLTGLTLTPPAVTRTVGDRVQFRAVGTYTDGTAQDLTSVVTWTSSNLAVTTISSPSGVATTSALGITVITAAHSDGVTASTTLTVLLLAPTITAVVPTAGAVGSTVTVMGTSMGTTSRVTFNGTTASFAIQSGSQVTATVPSGATSGPIQLVSTGGAAISPQPFAIAVAPGVTITTPLDGATVTAGRIRVGGTVTGSTGEIGVSVNGVPAPVYNGQWTVETTLSEGTQRITATATDAIGGQAGASITVTGLPATPARFVLQGLPNTGVPPLGVIWQVLNETGHPLVQFELDVTGTGTFDAPVSTLDGVRTIYATPGLWLPVVRATDDQGQQYMATTTIAALDRAEIDAALQAKWNAMRAALRAEAVELALEFFAPEQRPRYQTLFSALGNQLAQIGQELGDLQLVYLVEQRAKYRLRRTQLYGGQVVTLTYYVYFIQDAAGVWRLEEF